MNNLTKNDIEIIEVNGLVEYLRQVQHGYKRASTHSQDVIAHRIVEQTTEAKYPMNWGCAKCIFELYKRLSTYYFNSKEKIENEKKDTKNNNTTTSSTTTSKRRGRKPNGVKRSKP